MLLKKFNKLRNLPPPRLRPLGRLNPPNKRIPLTPPQRLPKLRCLFTLIQRRLEVRGGLRSATPRVRALPPAIGFRGVDLCLAGVAHEARGCEGGDFGDVALGPDAVLAARGEALQEVGGVVGLLLAVDPAVA